MVSVKGVGTAGDVCACQIAGLLSVSQTPIHPHTHATVSLFGILKASKPIVTAYNAFKRNSTIRTIRSSNEKP